MQDYLFAYRPRTGSPVVAYFALAIPVLAGAALVGAAMPGRLKLIGVLAALAVGGVLFALLVSILRRSQRGNVLGVRADGVLVFRAGLGGFGTEVPLAGVRSVAVSREGAMTKVWVDTHEGRRRLVGAFYGELSPDERQRMRAAAARFGVPVQ